MSIFSFETDIIANNMGYSSRSFKDKFLSMKVDMFLSSAQQFLIKLFLEWFRSVQNRTAKPVFVSLTHSNTHHPHCQYPHESGVFVRMDEPTLARHYDPRPLVYM